MNDLLPIPWFLPPIPPKGGLKNQRISKSPIQSLSKNEDLGVRTRRYNRIELNQINNLYEPE